jgi:hypothetical protein
MFGMDSGNSARIYSAAAIVCVTLVTSAYDKATGADWWFPYGIILVSAMVIWMFGWIYSINTNDEGVRARVSRELDDDDEDDDDFQ